MDSSAEDTAGYHVNIKGWRGIGYHFMVHWDGVIEYVGDLETARANVWGLNRKVVGILLPGNFMTRAPGDAQLDATRWLLGYLLRQLPGRAIAGHKDIALPASPTACPGDTFDQWRHRITA